MHSAVHRAVKRRRAPKPAAPCGIPQAVWTPNRKDFVTRSVRFFLMMLVTLAGADDALGQRVAKYGADFLAGGVGARALGMGGAFISVADDVYAGFWNPAGLPEVDAREVSYMHAERFSGIVSFDYTGFAVPFSDRSVLGVSLIRSGVNDIKNTLDAWDAERDQPIPDPESAITTFSAADYALLVAYGKRVTKAFSFGVTSKIIRRNIGAFATAWGYSMDIGVRYRTPSWHLGATVQDVTTMLQSWSVDTDRLAAIQDVFGDDLPEGGTELVLPVLRLGASRLMDVRPGLLRLAMDMDLSFDGATSYTLSLGSMAMHPRLGAELVVADRVAFRAGFNRIQFVDGEGIDLTPSVGTGFRWGRAALDYGFGDFAGLVSDLGYSHRISAQYRFAD